MDTGLTSDYLQALRDEAQEHGDFIMQGKCSDHASYRYKAGLVQGLQKAEQLLHDIIRQATDEFQDLDDED